MTLNIPLDLVSITKVLVISVFTSSQSGTQLEELLIAALSLKPDLMVSMESILTMGQRAYDLEGI